MISSLFEILPDIEGVPTIVFSKSLKIFFFQTIFPLSILILNTTPSLFIKYKCEEIIIGSDKKGFSLLRFWSVSISQIFLRG